MILVSLGGRELDLRYIKSTIGVGLVFEKDDHGKEECTCYVDSDYVGILTSASQL